MVLDITDMYKRNIILNKNIILIENRDIEIKTLKNKFTILGETIRK